MWIVGSSEPAVARLDADRAGRVRIVEGLDAPASPTPAPGETPPRGIVPARVAWVALAAQLTLISIHATGEAGWVLYPTVIAGAITCSMVGLWRNRPALRWPWWTFVGSGVVWAIGSSVGDVTESAGDLTSSRSLVPDLFLLPGYLLFGTALYGLMRSRRSRNERGALLDGVMLGAGALLLVNRLVIEPAMDRDDTWVMARLVVSLYPAISMCLIVLAARLAFSPGEHSPSFRFVLAGTLSLFGGDVLFALGELHPESVPQVLVEVPLLLVPACIGVAILHPDVRRTSRSTQQRSASLGNARLLSVAGALLAPIVVIATGGSDGTIVPTALCLVLAAAAVYRLASAMREQAEFEAKLSHQATHDELTGLPGRVLIVEHIDDMLVGSAETGESLLVMFIDLDQFKLVNDSMGHSMGDQLLKAAAGRIASCLGPTDLVGRISGDEFIVVGSGDHNHGFSLGERIRRVLGDGFDLDAGEVFVSVSIGITIAQPGDGSLAATLIQEADTAMYRSKEAGRDRVTLFDSSMRERVARRVDLERRLRHALSQGELAAHFQPLVRLPSGRVVGFEALARWSDDGHMISPAEFIPIAEESGLIVQLGAFMLDEACRHVAMWRTKLIGGERLYVSVNLSVRQMRESDIVDTVAETLQRYHLPGEALTLEITESVMMEDSVSTAAVMTGLRRLGVRLSVDDFGTGFSSLSYLKRFPVSCVKIDKSFVGGLGRHESDSSLVAAVIAMGQALDLESIAEGVETEEQATRLFELGCRHAQGYLFGRAVPAAEVPGLVRRLGAAGAQPARSGRRCIPAAS